MDILENQKIKALDHAKDEGYEVYKVYQDICSGGKDDRPGLNELRHDARLRKFKIVVFTSLSRMTRQGTEGAFYILRELESNKVQWHFTDMPILNFDANTPKLAKDIILSVLSAMDEDYRRTISEATKTALARKKALGKQLGRHKKDCTCPKHRKKTLPLES
jgi:DNA invertase Pin-like site-specific DNA recombinase